MKRVILITGISSGFGRETARLLSEAGHIVYGTVRSARDMTGQVNYLRMDLTDIPSLKTTVSDILDKEGRIDVLINNAGMHSGGPAETTTPEVMKLQIDTGFIGMVHLTREVISAMRRQGGGTVINMSSIGGLMGLPFQSYYSAGKFAVEGFSEALRMEVKSFNIKVVLINPGDFRTNNTKSRRQFLAPTDENDPYHQQYLKTLSVIEHDETQGGNPALLARKLVRIVECRSPRQRYIIASFDQKLAVLLKRILPGSLFRKIIEGHYKIK
ncbi:MAG: SDR family oxidoreductase [Bacteroidales bacterium]|jgi:NAD(P)-dependent dehydrogenase (short-subunit alcohol dehydrogenase family)|nr:SDR family oxidoreductase [Bacteroidales bacterium]